MLKTASDPIRLERSIRQSIIVYRNRRNVQDLLTLLVFHEGVVPVSADGTSSKTNFDFWIKGRY